jgi:alkyl hydroperoxide reductase subunit AhpF
LTDKLKVTVYDLEKDRALAEKYHVNKIPAILVNDRDNKDLGVKFYGFPGGYEINSFLAAVLEISGRKAPLPERLSARVAAVKKPVHIQVLVIPT